MEAIGSTDHVSFIRAAGCPRDRPGTGSDGMVRLQRGTEQRQNPTVCVDV